MNELWMRSVATIKDGKLDEFQQLVDELLTTAREKDSETVVFSAFLDEPAQVAVFIEEYASSPGWLAHRSNLAPLLPRFPEVCEFTAVEVYGDPTDEARAALGGAGPALSYYRALSAL